MTANEQNNINENNQKPAAPSASDLFTGPVHESLSQQQVFADNKDFHIQPTRPQQILHHGFSFIQKVIITFIFSISIMLFYALLKSPSNSSAEIKIDTPTTPAPLKIRPAEISAETPAQPPAKLQKDNSYSPEEPISLETAKNYYHLKDYKKSYDTFDRLYTNLSISDEDLFKGFLQFKMALCGIKLGNNESANKLLWNVAQSRSPVLRCLSSYYRSLLDTQSRKYLNARMRAYQTIALIQASNLDNDVSSSLSRICSFIAAQSLTQNILSLKDADKDCPSHLWNTETSFDIFDNVKQAQLESFLAFGSSYFAKASLGPLIEEVNSTDGIHRWSITSNGSSIEELLSRFAARTNMDIVWHTDNAQLDSKEAVRKRAVTLYLPAVTTQQFITIAVGCAGLIAKTQDDKVVQIYNPEDYSRFSEYLTLLTEEVTSLWQRYLLSFGNDELIPNVYFAVALLQAQQGKVTEALTQYKFLVNRFPQHPLASSALLNSGKLKNDLRDYSGARQDLLQLVEQYPDSEIAESASLRLADTTMKLGLYDQAQQLYRKIYNISLAVKSQEEAALGAGECFYNSNDYENTVKWLTKFVNITEDKNYNTYKAYLLLGKAYLAMGDYKSACDCLKNTMTTKIPAKEQVETISSLVKGLVAQQDFLAAINVLESVNTWNFSEKEMIEISIIKGRTLQQMGLSDKAIAILSDKYKYVSDPNLQLQLSFELAMCHKQQGNLDLAGEILKDVLAKSPTSNFRNQANLELADICLSQGQPLQTITICSNLTKSDIPKEDRDRAIILTSKAYSYQKKYEKAVLALLDENLNGKTQ